MNEEKLDSSVEAIQWGIPTDEIDRLGDRLAGFFHRYRPAFRTRTRDTSEYGLRYLCGLLRMEVKRTFSGIGRIMEVSAQNLQHFMSNSPWSHRTVIDTVQHEIALHPVFTEAMLVLDESAEQKAGEQSAGAGRQHNGRLGKVEMSQVGVFLSLVTPEVNLWIDGELFIPEHWFSDTEASRREAAEVPQELQFQTKPQLGLKMILGLKERGIPFRAVLLDSLYGRNQDLRESLDAQGLEYYGDVPSTTKVFLKAPKVHYPVGKRGKRSKNPVVTGGQREVKDVATLLSGQQICLRPNERGYLTAQWSRCRVWVKYPKRIREEWLLIRHDESGKLTFVLSNAAPDISLEEMARRKTLRSCIERSIEDAKSELGWDEFQARKYTAWKHHLALTILASWFIAETRLDWRQRFIQDPQLLEKYEVEVLPQLSVANVRTLLRAAMPLPELDSKHASQLVKEHLVNRMRSRKSRLRKNSWARGP